VIVKEAAPGGLEEEVVEQEVLEEEDATPEIEIVHPWGIGGWRSCGPNWRSWWRRCRQRSPRQWAPGGSF